MQGLGGTLLLILLFLFMYFMVIRPQQKQGKLRQVMLDNLKTGDKIVTIGGIYGKIIALDEKTMKLEVAPDFSLKMQRAAVGFIEDEEKKESAEEKK